MKGAGIADSLRTRPRVPAQGYGKDAMNCTHEIRYQSLFDSGRALTFPCDAAGRVPLDLLSERALANYLFARAAVGREYACPCVTPSVPH